MVDHTGMGWDGRSHWDGVGWKITLRWGGMADHTGMRDGRSHWDGTVYLKIAQTTLSIGTNTKDAYCFKYFDSMKKKQNVKILT